MDHHELVQEMPSVERMATQERLKHARKRRSQQLKKWGQYERQIEKESTKKKKNQEKVQQFKRSKRSSKSGVRFASNIAFLDAATRNDLNEVKRLLESGVSPDVTNEDGLTALHQCCIDNSEDLMKLLLEYNANVNACDSEMWTPLHAAATCGHVALCKQLIDRGAELLAVNADGNMPYDICEDEVTLDHIETEMAKRGITQEQIDMTRLATEHRMLTDLKDFASKGGNLEETDHNGATMLHIAAANGYVEVAEFLLDNHVSVDTRDSESWQPIHAAAYWAQQEILEMLVENGADLDSKTKNGETPFDLCEEPDLKQKILDMKDEIESKRSIRQQRQGSQRKHRVSSRNLILRGQVPEVGSLAQSSDSLYSSNSSLNLKSTISASIRRSSMRGDKSQLFKKEHKEEALHIFGVMHDEESFTEADEEHDRTKVTDIDEVTIVITNDNEPPSTPATKPVSVNADTSISQPVPGPAVTTINVGKPSPKPRKQSKPDSNSQDARPKDSQKPPQKGSPAGQKRELQTSQPVNSNLSQASTQDKGGQKAAPNTKPNPPQPIHQGASAERRQSSTLSDLKKHRSNSRENLVDAAVENMFLESVQGGRQQRAISSTSAGRGNSIRGRDKAKNGHNNNNSAYTDGQLQRFVAPNHSAVVGQDDKDRCCVIL